MPVTFRPKCFLSDYCVSSCLILHTQTPLEGRLVKYTTGILIFCILVPNGPGLIPPGTLTYQQHSAAEPLAWLVRRT